MNKANYKKLSFEKCIQKIIYTNKIKSEDYLPQGKYPIVSQEDSLISGYWNIETDVFHITSPVIIFGDHTRVLKYIDFSFVLGADGVKILQPVREINAKFFYYYLSWFKVPSLGYSRHYKLLKEIEVLVPPLPIQNQIVKELDTLQAIITKKKAQLEELDKLTQATFYDMFGDPVENERGWESKGLDFLCEKITDGEHFKPKTTEIGIPFLSAKDILQENISFKNTLFISQEVADKALKRCNPQKNDILIVSRGATVGRMNIVKTDRVFCLLGSVILLKLKKHKLSPYFLLYTLRNPDILNTIKGLSSASAQQALYLKDLRQLSIPIPPLPLQNQFAKRIEAIEKQKALINQSIAETQLLFDSAMDNYFN